MVSISKYGKTVDLHLVLGFLFVINFPILAAETGGIIKHLLNHVHNDANHLTTNSPPSCEFNNSICDYKIIQNGVYAKQAAWSLISNPVNETRYSPKGNYIALVGSGKEGDRSDLQSAIFQTSANDRVEFFYYLSGYNPGQLQVTFTQNKTGHKIGPKFWVDLEDHGSHWQYGCMEVPPNRTGYLIFTGILGVSVEKTIAVQKVSLTKGRCAYNVQSSTCTFDNPMICNYTLVCTPATEYTWKRHKGATPTPETGPHGDVSEPFDGFYLYADSSYGNEGDLAIVNFPVENTTGRYLHFWYHMNGKDVGSLNLRYNFIQSSKDEWTIFGNQGNKWRHYCQQFDEDVDSFSLVAVRGSSSLGDIAIDNVRVDNEQCLNNSLDCNFNSPSICGYKYSHWLRRKTTNGFQMSSNTSVNSQSMESPTENLFDSCVQIRYKMSNEFCMLIIYKNLQMLFSLPLSQSWTTAQFYVKKSTMYLKFDARNVMICESFIDSVNVVKGACPALECPKLTKSCNDRQYCVPKMKVCNNQSNCQDGSDEICLNSIACDFEDKNNCGYRSKDMYDKLKESRNNSDYYIRLLGLYVNFTSPVQKVINDSCVQFSYRGITSQLVVYLLDSQNRNGVQVWFKVVDDNQWSVGQFSVSAGHIQLVFNEGGVFTSYVDLDDIRLISGSCPPEECDKDQVLCADKTECVKKTNICNRRYDCTDQSDESDCNRSVDCDFEDPYLCGYNYNGSWIVIMARSGIPRLDHSQGSHYGYYMMQQNSRGRLFSPKFTVTNVTCVRFHFILTGKNAVLNVYDNNVVKLQVKSNQILEWQMVQLQMDAGNHSLGFRQITEDLSYLAIDSISKISAECPQINCPERWKPCSTADICVPEFRFCDGITDCPKGEDENECTTNGTIRLVYGENVNQGHVEYRINGTWYKVCNENSINNSSKENAMVACRELGYNGTSRDTFRSLFQRQDTSNIRHVSCKGNERSISECAMKFCYNCFCPFSMIVDCSNSHCLSDQVPCPSEKGKPYDSSTRCIWKHNLCDGEYDCPGGTDEKNCKDCNVNEFRCRNKQCIPLTQRCNGIPECQDSSDERDCFMHNRTSIFLMYNGKYEAICETNFNKQLIANELCKLAGRDNGTVIDSTRIGRGVEFMVSTTTKTGIIPGYDQKGIVSCKLLNLMCNAKNCGTRAFFTNIEPTIKYGIFALPGEWPWQVAIYRETIFICGGTLIDKRYVLTATHCVNIKANYYVKAGSINKFYTDLLEVKTITTHPGFDTNFKNDVALLELLVPVTINDNVQIACLPTQPAIPNARCYTTGWGDTENGVMSEYLKETKVRILRNETCKSYYPHSDKVAICANHADPYQPACFGDSGGPLQCLNKNSRWEVVGVTSYGMRQCLGHKHSPQAFADVYVYLDWIKQHAPNLYQ